MSQIALGADDTMARALTLGEVAEARGWTQYAMVWFQDAIPGASFAGPTWVTEFDAIMNSATEGFVLCSVLNGSVMKVRP